MWQVVCLQTFVRLRGDNMLVLTGISFKNNKVEVYDSEDGTKERVSLTSLIGRIGGMNERIYGIRLYDNSSFYPPDARRVPGTDVIIIPSEAQNACRALRI